MAGEYGTAPPATRPGRRKRAGVGLGRSESGGKAVLIEYRCAIAHVSTKPLVRSPLLENLCSCHGPRIVVCIYIYKYIYIFWLILALNQLYLHPKNIRGSPRSRNWALSSPTIVETKETVSPASLSHLSELLHSDTTADAHLSSPHTNTHRPPFLCRYSLFP